MSERALQDQPDRRKFKRTYGSKDRKSGLQEKTGHKRGRDGGRGSGREETQSLIEPDFACIFPFHLHTLVSLHPLNRVAPVRWGHCQPSPSSAHLALGQPSRSSLGRRRQGSVSRALFCSSFRGLEAATGPSHLRGPLLPRIPLRQACALAPATHWSPLGPAPPWPSRRLLGSTEDSTRPFPARQCRCGPEELPFSAGFWSKAVP